MAPNPRVTKACKALGLIGVPPDVVKSALKELLEVYDNNWSFIEENDYQVLTDAIFFEEVPDHKSKEKLRTPAEKLHPRHVETGSPPAEKKVRTRDVESRCPAVHQPPKKKLRSSHYVGGSKRKLGKVEQSEEERDVHMADGLKRCLVASQNYVTRNLPGVVESSDGEMNTLEVDDIPISVVPPASSVHFQAFEDGPKTIDGSVDELWSVSNLEIVLLGEPDPVDAIPVDNQKPKMHDLGSPARSDMDISEGDKLHIKDEPSEASDSGTSVVNENDVTSDMRRFDLVSSPNGDMKVSLLVKLDTGVPNVEAALQDAGKLLSRKYGINESDFCVIDVFKEFCNSLLKLNREPVDGVEVSSPDVATDHEMLSSLSRNNSADVNVDQQNAHALVLHTAACDSDVNILDDFEDSSKMVNLDNCGEMGAKVEVLRGHELSLVTSACAHEENQFTSTTKKCTDQLSRDRTMDVIVDQQNALVLHSKVSKSSYVTALDKFDLSKIAEGDNFSETDDKGEVLKGQELSLVTFFCPLEENQSVSTTMKYIVDDITRGEENLEVPVVRDTSLDTLPSRFKYIPHSVIYRNAHVNFSLAQIPDGDCCSSCYGNCLESSTTCPCVHQNGGKFAYTLDGLLKEKFLDECISLIEGSGKYLLSFCKDCPLFRSWDDHASKSCEGHSARRFIKECWHKCGCSKHCGNRVVQRGITVNLQVFWKPDEKGWGLRASEELPRGSFVCEYVGEIMTIMELYERKTQRSDKEAYVRPVVLDAHWSSGSTLEDGQALCLDATCFGNVARFINHRDTGCNLVAIPVEIENPDHHYYHLAFFTKWRTDSLEELTWDFGIEFDNQNRLTKASKSRFGSQYCCDIK